MGLSASRTVRVSEGRQSTSPPCTSSSLSATRFCVMPHQAVRVGPSPAGLVRVDLSASLAFLLLPDSGSYVVPVTW